MIILRLGFLTLIPVALSCNAKAQPSPSSWQGVPAQVIPQAYETGAPAFTTPAGSSSFMGNSGSSAGGGGSADASVTGDGGSSYQNMMSQSYGQTALDTSTQIGNNPNAVAAFGQLESGFQNIPTANGSSSATGPWQITTPTWNEYVSKYNLPYTSADRTNPQAQAVVSNYIIKDYASSVSSVTNAPATIGQTYGAYVFGPQSGGRLAAATDPNAPMSNYISAQGLQK